MWGGAKDREVCGDRKGRYRGFDSFNLSGAMDAVSVTATDSGALHRAGQKPGHGASQLWYQASVKAIASPGGCSAAALCRSRLSVIT